ncbi:Midasin [Neolecta irregularis DAH-3]|uniref:Midasin n=1 Tax=Neolecta irregularis (strain DAH-3) TaxID=1198029 RepID=A0A1U7LWR6_NEOID|nr:Midasin [Neolecta irregularis DAH-3]|eukprot:OLL27013.1 Midasin [Neolecta irregularis DAH-3]
MSTLALSPRLTLPIYHHFQPIFPDLVARWNDVEDPDAVVIAFGRILPIDRDLNFYAQRYLSDNRQFFRKISHISPSSGDSSISAIDAIYLQNILLAVHRLLSFDYQEFKNLVGIQTVQPFLRHPDRAVRFLVVRILCILTNAADAARDTILEKHVGKESIFLEFEGLENQDLTLLPLLEIRRINAAKKLHGTIDYFTKTDSRRLTDADLSPNIVNLCDTQIILTPTTRLNVQNIAKGLLSNEPILLHGSPGSGKSFLLEQVSKRLGRYDDIVRIHLSEQTDAKLLLGTYISTTTPGSFEWKDGILTTAVQRGSWILIEDVDRAPNDVLSVFLPLMESRYLSIPSRGEKIHAGKGFQLIGTMGNHDRNENVVGSRLWRRIQIVHPDDTELLDIVRSRYPQFGVFSEKVLQVFGVVQSTFKESSFLSICKTGLGRMITTRDLIKWSNRINALFEAFGISAGAAISADIYDGIFQEACDCFAGMIPNPEGRYLLVQKIGKIMELPLERIGIYLSSHVPRYHRSDTQLIIGRASLPRYPSNFRPRTFANTNHALRLMEQLASSIRLNEPILLVGETGTGKTTVIQHLAETCGHNLTVINLSQQTESGDLLGGYKPIDSRAVGIKLKEKFDQLFSKTFSGSKTANNTFLEVVAKVYRKQQWSRFVVLLRDSVKMAEKKFAIIESTSHPKKKRRTNQLELLPQWKLFASEIENFEKSRNGFAFSFVEGTFVKAVRAGDWVLLDEINLAAHDTIESISSLLQENPQIVLSDKADLEPIKPHPEFRVFACMNPATDVGKRDLPAGLRSRFTEIYVASPDQDMHDLVAIIKKYIGRLTINEETICAETAQLYSFLRNEAKTNKIVDGARQKPHFSIRTLSRTLMYVCDMASIYGVRRSLYEGFCMSFLTLLDKESEIPVRSVIEKTFLGSPAAVKSILSQIPRCPHPPQNFVQFEHYWMPRGDFPIEEQSHYIITPFVKKNMLNLSRAIATGRIPVLIQGPTSTGKTSMIDYIAKKTGHKFVRINNHEHTDLQEYIGTYVSNDEGKLAFVEGILVEALRKGHWIVLDELNLAPSDVLEALNRLLDDNRELHIPETQEIVKPHPNFMLFATQNPPGLYGGRKYLSRAFRNRFLELHFDDIPEEELEIILCERCKIAPSYCKKIVEVYKQLAVRRQTTRLFEQKKSFATLRDLFRWAGREAIGYQQLAENGYMLLAERIRRNDERQAVKLVIEKVMKVIIDESTLYNCQNLREFQQLERDSLKNNMVWTKALKRVFTLVVLSLRYREPVLLVGETGCGKTSICQFLATAFGRKLHILNAHQNTETGDIIGTQRPFRGRQILEAELGRDVKTILLAFQQDSDADLSALLKAYRQLNLDQIIDVSLLETIARVEGNIKKCRKLFEWQDGCLVQAMKQGDFFLLDEISLAEDSVLERLNSVLETERSIVLAERGTDSDKIIAVNEFRFLATMNPGGDYGKRELSPALRNRFTEIWVPAITNEDDITFIVQSRLISTVSQYANFIVRFSRWFIIEYDSGAMTTVISIRDILSWTHFVNSTVDLLGYQASFFSGAAMVLIDSLGANTSSRLTTIPNALQFERTKCYNKLAEIMQCEIPELIKSTPVVNISNSLFDIGIFGIPRGSLPPKASSFNMNSSTTALNAMRVARALHVRKPVLLEGSPGVGKTSLISAIAAAAGYPLTRINLSEQTDLIDLFGSDVPVEGGQNGEFTWRNAPFLQAMQQGHWVLLDEMNLASQSVLEGLNSCLDHRGEAYIPELDRSFNCDPQFRVFAAQNPHDQGGGRKGLPRSFINRFTVVYVEPLTQTDMMNICCHVYPQIDQSIIAKIIEFMTLLGRKTVIEQLFGHDGAPWEFNLRDAMRWLDLLSCKSGFIQWQSPLDFLDVVIKQRFRNDVDRNHIDDLCAESFGTSPTPRNMHHHMTKDAFQVGHSILERSQHVLKSPVVSYSPLTSQLLPLELMMLCIQQRWPVILVGPSGSGKTTMIRVLSSIVGANLEEFSLNNDIDTMDLLGGFEQVDIFRQVRQFLDDTKDSVVKSLVSSAFIQDSSIAFDVLATAFYSDSFKLDKISALLLHLAMVFETSSGSADQVIAARARTLHHSIRHPSFTGFEWLDGILLRAVEQGKWLVLDNANLCSSSVLDRLNSLLEPKGYLTVNERNEADGQPRVVVPHKNFRLFLTINPRYGELSRAMRNRGIEIFIPQILIDEIPDKCYAGQIESDFYRIQSLERSLVSFGSQMRNESVVNKLLRNLTEFFPHSRNTMFQNWLKSSSELQFTQIGTLYEMLTQHPFVEDIQKHYSEVQRYLKLPASYMLSINSINNPYIIAPLSADCQLHVRSFDLSLVYEILCLWKSISDLMEQYLSQSRRKIPSRMTFLERSLSLLEVPQSSTPQAYESPELAKFINSVVVKGNNWLSQRRYECATRLELNAFEDFLIILRHLLENAASENFNPSHLHTYRKVLEDSLQRNNEAQTSPLIFDLLSSLNEFSQTLKLNRGFSMKCIWSAFRIERPTNEAAWVFFNDSVQLLSQFERAASSSLGFIMTYVPLSLQDLNMVIQAKRTFIAAIIESQCSSKILHDSDGLFKSIRDLTAQLVSVIIPRETSVLQTQAFRTLVQYQMLHSKFSNDTLLKSETMELLHLSGISSTEVLSAVLSKDKSILLFLLNRPETSNFMSDSKRVRDDLADWLNGEALSLFLKNHSRNQSHSLRYTHDARFQYALLGREIARSTESMCSDKLDFLLLSILLHFIQIIKLHLEIPPQELESSDKWTFLDSMSNLQSTRSEDIVQICLVIQQIPFVSITAKYFSKLWLSHFSKVIGFIEAFVAEREYSKRLYLSGQATIQFSKSLLLLYVPDKPYDPAMEAIVEHHIYEHKCFGLREELEVRRWVEFNISGSSSSPTIDLLGQRIEELSPQSPILTVNRYRPRKPQIASIYQDIENFMSIVVTSSLVENLVENLCSGRQNAILETKMFRQTWNHFVDKLRKDYASYVDLLEPLCQMVERLILGVSLVACGTIWKQNELIRNDRGCIFQDLLSIPHILASSSTRADVLGLATGLDTNLFGETYWLVHLAKDSFKRTLSQTQKVCYSEQPFIRFLKHHTLKIQIEKEEAAAANSLYRNVPDENDSIEDKVRGMFPDFEDDIGSVVKETDGDNIAMALVKLHEQLFGELYDPVLVDFDGILADSRRIFCDAIQIDPIGITPSIEPLIVQIAIINHSSYLSPLKSRRTQRPYSFYKDPNFEEAESLRSHLLKLDADLEPLLDLWPEHATLQDAQISCQALLDMPESSPLAAFLSKLERLFFMLDDWEKVASRHYSISERQTQLRDLIIKWRRLELNSWSQLFDLEDHYCRESASKWWYNLYESCVRNPLQILEDSSSDLSSHILDLSGVVNSLLQSSNKGQFETRLRIVQAFWQHASVYQTLYPEFRKIADMLGNITHLYSQFLHQVQSSILEQRKILEKDISEVAKLASWRDTNVFALRESSKKSHYSLYKVVRKYQEVLQQPLSTILEVGIVLETRGNNSSNLCIASLGQIPEVVSELPVHVLEIVLKSNNRPSRLIEIKPTISRMRKIFQNSVSSGDIFISSHLENFTGSLLENIRILQKETPVFLDSENESAVKNLKVRKHKLFADTLKHIRQWGIKSNISADIIRSQASVAELMCSLPALETSATLSHLDKQSERMSQYFFAILESIPRCRAAALGHSTDLTHSEVRRASVMFEFLLSVVLNERRVVVANFNDLKIMQRTIQRIRELTPDNASAIITAPRCIEKLENLKSCCRLLPLYLHDIIKTINRHNDLIALDNCASLVEVLQDFKSVAEDRCQSFSEQATSELKISTCIQFSLIDDFVTFCKEIFAFINRSVTITPSVKYIIQPFSEWISEVISSARLAGIETLDVIDEDSSLKKLNAGLQELCDSVLVSVQKLCPALGRLSGLPDLDEERFNQSHANLKALNRSLHLSSILSCFQKCIDITRNLNIARTQVEVGRHVFVLWCLVRPFLEQYSQIVEQTLSIICDQHSSVCKTVFILQKLYQDVARKGFCTPQAGETDPTKATGLSEGTGLGDGEGAKNISDDLPDQEDLEDFAKQPDAEKNEPEDKKKGDDAIDVDADFEADIESLDHDEGSDESNDGNDNEQDPEDRIGDVDDLDPATVDEKLWNEKGEEDKLDEGKNIDQDGKSKEQDGRSDVVGKEDGKNDEKKEKQKPLEGEEQKEGKLEEESEDNDDRGNEDHDLENREQDVATERIPDAEIMDLPDDMELDQEGKDESEGDDKMSDLDIEEIPDEKNELQGENAEELAEDDEDNRANQPQLDKTEAEEMPQAQDDDFQDINEVSQGIDGKNDNQEETSNSVQGTSGQKDESKQSTANEAAERHIDEEPTAQDNPENQQMPTEAGNAQQSAAKDAQSQKTNDLNLEQRPPQRDSNPDPLRKLGETLEEWRKQIAQQAEHSDTNQEQIQADSSHANELEHIQNDETAHDTQALGSATQTQAQRLEEAMVLDSKVEQAMPPVEQDIEMEAKSDVEVDGKTERPKDDEINEGRQCSGAIIGLMKEGTARGELEDHDMNLEQCEIEDKPLRDQGLEYHYAGSQDYYRSFVEGRAIWQEHELSTRDLANSLCEQLRLILEPTLATKMRGDFRTGKRLNMKRIIPYIASQFKKDKIWMRRTKPSKRQYQIMIAMDDSKSMAESESVRLAFETLSLVSKALTQLEAGSIAIASFGENFRLVHPFHQTFTFEAGVKVCQQFGFSQVRTNVKDLVRQSIIIFESAKNLPGSNASLETWQLQIIISDGICEDHSTLQQLVRQAAGQKIMMIFVIVDALGDRLKKDSIMDMNSVQYTTTNDGQMKLEMTRYLDTFPFQYFVVVRDVIDLPGVLSSALRQWFAEISQH